MSLKNLTRLRNVVLVIYTIWIIDLLVKHFYYDDLSNNVALPIIVGMGTVASLTALIQQKKTNQ